MPQQNLSGGSMMLLFGLFSSIFMFFFRPLLHFVLNIVARRYTGLNADQIRRMDVGSSITAIRSAVSSFTERPAASSGQPNYATTVLLHSEVCSQLDFQQLRTSPTSTLEMDEPCSVFVLPQADPRENETLARLRATLARDAVCVDPRFGRTWRVSVDAATALSKANQLGFVTVSSCAGNNNVNTWTLGCVDKNKPTAADAAAESGSRSIGSRGGFNSMLSTSQRNDERASTPGARASPENGGDIRRWFWAMLRDFSREIEDNVLHSQTNNTNTRRRQSPLSGNNGPHLLNSQQSTDIPRDVRHGLSGEEYSRQYPVLGEH